ncbi:MAG: VWA domain-containing protein [Ignavibacteriae bacterium]|nr:VWA domain-containing protein [Ignavibacteriota bacterium]NOG98899.1 VWA domain-containing protein [Ignavibacteriota bacterium]
MKNLYKVIFLLFLSVNIVFSSGLIVPTDENYPKDLLRNKSAEITVNIYGSIAETIVYEEFVNEGYENTDGVYSFPLPLDARSLKVYYWRNDTLFQAILKVQPQEPNPGTGTGGIAAQVNDYIGKNGLRMKLLEIEPGEIQKVELHYLSFLKYHNGLYSYKYPLNTSRFINYQIDYLNINVNVETDLTLTEFGSNSHPAFNTISSTNNSVKISYNKSKAYLASDFEFFYTVENDDLSVQFLSTKLNTTGGHFALFYNTERITDNLQTMDNKIVFVLENSSNMYGAKLFQSINAIKEGLLFLDEGDKFNITLFNSTASNWRNELQIADSSNINEAIQFLENISNGGGSNLESGLAIALGQFADTSSNNSIVVFTTGLSSVNIPYIQSLNNFDTGIFSIGVGTNVSRARLEILSGVNNGLTYYFSEANYNRSEVVKFMEKVCHPIARNIKLSFEKDDIHEHLPIHSPSLFAGSNFYNSGKYDTAENTFFAILGTARDSQFVRIFQADFTGDSVANSFADKIWAKSKMDMIEWEIEINGETTELKDSLINLSLVYGIRCRYTAYIADYENIIISEIDEDKILPPGEYSVLKNNYPNPFNPTTTLRFYISTLDAGKIKLVKIFNILGQLIYVIDISDYTSGWHEVVFNGKDYFGNSLASGTYLVSLHIADQIKNTIKIVMIK